MLEAAAAVLSLLGYLLVIRQHWAGMALWAVSNTAWLGIALAGAHWAQAVMWAAYLAGAVWGVISWRSAERR